MVLKKFKRIKGITLNGLIIVIICGAIFGYGTGVISNVTSSFLGPNKSNMTLEDTMITSSVLLGAFFGSLMSGAISDKIGRRNTLLVGAAIAIAGNTICMLAFGNYIVMAIGRFVFGLALGPISSVGPLYLSECVADDMRGFLGTFFQFSITFSIFLGVLWGFGAFKPNFWYIELGFIYLLAIPLLVYTFFSPDTPRFLVDRDNEKAKELFMQFMTEEEAMAEMNTIREKRKVKSTWGQLFAKQNSRAIMIGLVLAAAQQLTGINAIIYYFNAVGEIIFQSNTTAIAATFSGIMFWNCVTSMAAIPLTSRYGRRTLLLVGQGIMFISLAITGCAFFFAGAARSVLSILGISLFILGFEISVGPLFFVVINEIFHESLRGRIGSTMTSIQWLFNFVINVSFLFVNKALSPDSNNPTGYVFFIFMGFGLLTFLYQLFYLPETKGKSLAQLQEELGAVAAKEGAKPVEEENDLEVNRVIDDNAAEEIIFSVNVF